MEIKLSLLRCAMFMAILVGISERAAAQLGHPPRDNLAVPPVRNRAIADLELTTLLPLGEAGCQCIGDINDAAARIKKTLAEPLHERGLDFDGTSLEQVIAEIATAYHLPIQLDVQALDAAGQGPADPIRIHIRGVTLQSALRHLLRQVKLSYLVEDEVLLITTPTEAENHQRVCLYDVRDIVSGPAMASEIEVLLDTVISCVHPEDWVDSGGTGEIRALEGGVLVVAQTDAVHERIGQMLAAIRKTMGRPPVGAAANWQPPEDRVVIKVYPVQIAAENREAVQKQLREMIVTLLPEHPWTGTLPNGEPVALQMMSDQIIVRHKTSVQRQVESLLRDMGIKVGPQPGGGEGGQRRPGGFGGGGGGFFQVREVER